MTEINKQKFIAELGKLLAFMYEEDRAAALEMYIRMFDEATDEEALIKQLVSPTRQAVVIARAYNAKERSIALGVKSPAGGSTADNNPDQSAELPTYAKVVGQIQEEVRAKQNMSAAVTQEPAQTQAEPEEAESMEPELAPETEHECVQPADEEEQAPEQADAAAAEEAEDTGPEETEAVEAEGSEPEEGSAPEAAEEETSEPAEEAVEGPAPETESEPTEEASGEAVEENDDKVEEIIDRAVLAEEPAVATEAEPVEYVRKLRVFPLILYIIAAIPVGLIGIAIMLIPALVFLVFATACVWFGIFLVSCAFSGMRILADILIVLGVSLVLFAAGLLFLWTFIWFIGGAMAGFVRGIIRLGDKWCHKEVAA